MKICIIGLGPLGRRHAEGVVSSKRSEVLTLLDLSTDALSEGKSFLSNLEANIQQKFCSIEFIQQYSKLKSQYDILIIATLKVAIINISLLNINILVSLMRSLFYQ